jgi:hypothetical protein
MTETSHRCFWRRDDLVGYDIPVSSTDYLLSRGLPCRVGDSTIEFGIYYSPDRCVIGQDFDYPIYIARDGTVWHESGDGALEPQFMNTSVEHLDQFITSYLTWFVGVEDDRSALREAIEHTTSSLRGLDPPAFTSDRWIWPQIWEDLLAQC